MRAQGLSSACARATDVGSAEVPPADPVRIPACVARLHVLQLPQTIVTLLTRECPLLLGWFLPRADPLSISYSLAHESTTPGTSAPEPT